MNVDRRGLLAGSIAWSLTAFERAPSARPRIGLEFASARAFSYERLRQRAKSLATHPYAEPVPPSPEIVKALDFAVSQKIAFRSEYELWPNGPGEFPVRFFHLSKYADIPVKIHVLKDGVSREIVYSSRYFTFGGTDVEKKLPPELGFSGFRVMNGHGIEFGLGRLSGRELFSYFGRRGPIRNLGARNCRQYCPFHARGVSPLHGILAGPDCRWH